LSGESVIKELIGLILLSAALFVLLCWQEHLALTEVETVEHNGLYFSVRRGCPANLTVRWHNEIIHVSNIHLGSLATRILTRCLLNCRRESWGTITALLFP